MDNGLKKKGFLLKKTFFFCFASLQVCITNYSSLSINGNFIFYLFLKLLILPKKMCFSKNFLKFIIQFFFKNLYLVIRIYVLNALITSNFLHLWNSRRKGLLHSAPQSLFISYNSFSLWLTENIHKQKHFLKAFITCIVYIIFLWNV